ncbi:MAG: hypothetical protein LC667_01810 [Thioalkalivibrio sp.]|nr:hypothetical protein [Thioalkalivibrio sp.]
MTDKVGNYRAVAYQAVAFTPDEAVSGPKLLRSLGEDWLATFNGEPAVYGLPEEAPREIPRLVLVTADESYRCEISAERIAVLWRVQDSASEVVSPAEFFSFASRWIAKYMKLSSARVARVGALRTTMLDVATPGQFLASRFCKESVLAGPLRNVDGFEMHAHERITLRKKLREPHAVNSWVRSKTANLTQDGSTRSVAIVEQDINTLSEDVPVREFSAVQVRALFGAAADALDSAFERFYAVEVTG